MKVGWRGLRFKRVSITRRNLASSEVVLRSAATFAAVADRRMGWGEGGGGGQAKVVVADAATDNSSPYTFPPCRSQAVHKRASGAASPASISRVMLIISSWAISSSKVEGRTFRPTASPSRPSLCDVSSRIHRRCWLPRHVAALHLMTPASPISSSLYWRTLGPSYIENGAQFYLSLG